MYYTWLPRFRASFLPTDEVLGRPNQLQDQGSCYLMGRPWMPNSDRLPKLLSEITDSDRVSASEHVGCCSWAVCGLDHWRAGVRLAGSMPYGRRRELSKLLARCALGCADAQSSSSAPFFVRILCRFA